MIVLDTGTISVIIAAAGAGFAVGVGVERLRTRISHLEERLNRPADKQEAQSLLFNNIKSNIKWTQEMKEDFKSKALKSSGQEKEVYERLISELEVKIEILKSSLNDYLEKKD
jgi:hypothetical protein